MTASTIAAIRFFHVRTIYVTLPLIALFVFLGVFLFAGTLYGAGIIRGATYAGIMIVLSALFVLVLLATAGLFFFVRVYR